MSLPSLFLLPSIPLFLFLTFPASFVSAVCQPSLTTICVSHDGIQYVLQGGVSNQAYISTPSPRPPLVLFQGQTYSFELTETGNFLSHPFVLTSDGTGGCQENCGQPEVGLVEDGDSTTSDGVILGTQAGTVVHFTAQNTEDVGEVLWYQCQYHSSMGNQITIEDAATYIFTGGPTSNATSTASSTGVDVQASSTGATGEAGVGTDSSTAYIPPYVSSTGLGGGGGVITSTGVGGGGGVVSSTGVGGGVGITGGGITGGVSTGGGGGGTTGPGSGDPNGVLMKSSVNWIVGGIVTLIAAIAVNSL